MRRLKTTNVEVTGSPIRPASPRGLPVDIMSKYIRIYETLCPDDLIHDDDPRRSAIIAEMRAIHRAKNEGLAEIVVAWWGAWPTPQHGSAREFVRAARKMMSNA